MLFMPIELVQWSELNGVRNPSKLTEVHKLVERVKKLEVLKLSITPKAQRPLTSEF